MHSLRKDGRRIDSQRGAVCRSLQIVRVEQTTIGKSDAEFYR
jgi:hypothetical protein